MVDHAPAEAFIKVDYSSVPQRQEVGNTTWWLSSRYVLICVSPGAVASSGLVVGGDGAMYTLGRWYWKDAARAAFSLAKQAASPCSTCPEYFSLVQYDQGAFQHIAFDTLPKVPPACDFLQQSTHVRILVANRLHADLINEVCHISPASRFEIHTGSKHGSTIYLPQFRPALQMGLTQAGIFKPLGRIGLFSGQAERKASTHHIIYFQRTPEHERAVQNNEELVAALRATGAEVETLLNMENWREDRVRIEKAHYLIGPHGGAFSNMVFASKGATVVEFSPMGYHSGLWGKLGETSPRPCFMGLALSLGLRYVALSPEDAGHFSYFKPMRMNITSVREFFAKEFS